MNTEPSFILAIAITSWVAARRMRVLASATPLALAWPVPQLREPVSYALGRGPATVTDIKWWFGSTLTAVRGALAVSR